MSFIYNLFTIMGQNPWTKLDKTNYVLIMSRVMSGGIGKTSWTKPLTKPRHNLDIDIDIDNDIDINIMSKDIIFFGVMSKGT